MGDGLVLVAVVSPAGSGVSESLVLSIYPAGRRGCWLLAFSEADVTE